MKLARVLALVVAAGLAVLAVWLFTRPPAESPRDVVTAPVEGTGAAFDPEPGRGVRKPEPPSSSGGQETAPAAPVMPTELPDVGTPVKPGQEVSVVIPWTARTGSGGASPYRYEIEDFSAARDRETGIVESTWTWWRVALAVVQGDGSGAARVRLTVESARFRGFQENGLPYDIDSRDPKNPLLDDPVLGRRFRPLLATFGRPLEFRLDAGGGVVDLDGVEDWRERYIDEVRRLEKGAVNEVTDAPDATQLIDMWCEFFFPRTGGGTLAGGARRDWTRTQMFAPPWAVVWRGRVEATRDDPDAFRVEFRAAPTAERVEGGPQGGFGAQLVAVRTVGGDESYHAAYRFGRAPGTLLAAHIEATYQLWHSQKSGGGPGPGAGPAGATFAPKFLEIRRRMIVRRTDE